LYAGITWKGRIKIGQACCELRSELRHSRGVLGDMRIKRFIVRILALFLDSFRSLGKLAAPGVGTVAELLPDLFVRIGFEEWEAIILDTLPTEMKHVIVGAAN
jgi:hypothetical protein